jgi:hypothetical protein
MSILKYLTEELSNKTFIVYHGSGTEFDKFNEQRKDGIWFTDNIDVAIEYADPSYTAKDDSIVYTVELSPKNPIHVDAQGNNFEHLIYPPMYIDTHKDDVEEYDGEHQQASVEWEYSSDEIFRWAISKGYDCVIIHNINDAPFQGHYTEESTIYGVASNDIIRIKNREYY